ncbi:MAG: hypothetical protein ACUVTP_07305 [Candidatus Fervidibacter sp.]|uniref:hypothetical protein n=1 Tax=Candidatus Fervidibacter sp. TaxID=3100871 RepID=UPI0040492A61
MSERFWILAAAAIVIVVAVFSVWYFFTARSTKHVHQLKQRLNGGSSTSRK